MVIYQRINLNLQDQNELRYLFLKVKFIFIVI